MTSASEPGRLWYVDTSVLLRIALGHSTGAADWYDQEVTTGGRFATSRLTRLESLRVFRRESLALDLADKFFDSLTLLGVDHALLTEAGSIVPHLRTLNALHIASAQRIGTNTITIASHDANMLRTAAQLGFDVLDPVTD